MAIVGVARQTSHANHQTFPVRGDDGDLDAEFIRLPCLAIGNPLNFRGMQAVELVSVFGLALHKIVHLSDAFNTWQTKFLRKVTSETVAHLGINPIIPVVAPKQSELLPLEYISTYGQSPILLEIPRHPRPE